MCVVCVGAIARVLLVGEKYSVTGDVSHAGAGHLLCYLSNNNNNERLDANISVDRSGRATITYTPVTETEYRGFVTFGGQLVPGGDFVQQVSGAGM